MKTIANYPDLASARLAQSLLEAEGIHSFIPDEHLAGIDWQMGTALKGIRLQVGPEEEEAAKALLAEHLADVDLESDEDDSPRESCESCGSDQIGRPKWKNRVKAATLFFPPLLLLWPFFALFGPSRQCASCGRSWKVRK